MTPHDEAVGWTGVPENPERDGWHWVKRSYYTAKPYCWVTYHQYWLNGSVVHSTEWMSRGGAKYLGPALTPSDVAAHTTTLTATSAQQAAENEALRDMLERAAYQFEFYAAAHQAKCTPEGNDKANVNRSYAKKCRSVLPASIRAVLAAPASVAQRTDGGGA